MREGKRLTPSPNLEQIRDRARYELSRLPEPCRRLQNPEPYLCSTKTPSGYGETLIFLWPNLRKSPLKVVVDQQASVVVGFQPVVEVDLVQIGRYQFFAEFVSFRT
jgi:nicotinate phosphoribosyltransferase family protein